MKASIVILSPTEVVPGAVAPSGHVVESATMYVNEAAGLLVMDVRYKGGTQDVLTWPLGGRWQGVNGTVHTSLPGGAS